MSQTSPLMSKSTQTNITKLSGEIELTTASEPKAIENKSTNQITPFKFMQETNSKLSNLYTYGIGHFRKSQESNIEG